MTFTTAAMRLRSSRALRVGVAIGVGVTARAIASRASISTPKGLVDWERAERMARRRLSKAPGRLTPQQLRATAPAYARHMDRIVPLLEERLGAELPGVVDRHAVVSRADWATANIVTFKSLIGHLEPHLIPQSPEGSVRHGFAAATNRLLTTGQIGFLLGYLGGRVLGQYDVALLSAEQEPGRLLYVEENIRATARAVKVPVDDFRLWVALHETTHAFELEAHPWLRPYIRSRLERQVALFAEETRQLQRRGLGHLARRWRQAAAEGSIRGFMSPEQRGLFKETQLVMSDVASRLDGVSVDGVSTASWPGSPEWTSSWSSIAGVSASSRGSAPSGVPRPSTIYGTDLRHFPVIARWTIRLHGSDVCCLLLSNQGGLHDRSEAQ